MKKRLLYSILYISDSQPDHILFDILNDNGFEVIDRYIKENLRSTMERIPQIVIINTDSKEYAVDVMRILRDVKELSYLPKIVLTDNNNFDDKIEILENGCFDCIIKPFNPKELIAKLNSYLLNSLYISKVISECNKLKSLSLLDQTTGLYTRGYLDSRIVEEVSRASRMGECLSFGIIECSNYKQIVETYGEAAINYVLKEIGATVKQLARLSDVLIRYADNQLAVLSPITNKGGIDTFMDRLIHKLNDSIFEYNGQVLKFSVKIGGYTLESSDFNTFENKVENLIKFSEIALERAKGSSLSRIEFYE